MICAVVRIGFVTEEMAAISKSYKKGIRAKRKIMILCNKYTFCRGKMSRLAAGQSTVGSREGRENRFYITYTFSDGVLS